MNSDVFRVLHLSTHDQGGAAKAAYRLHCTMLQAGHQSVFGVLFKSTTDADVIQFVPGVVSRIRNLIRRWTTKRARIPSNRYYFMNAYEAENYFPTSDLLSQMPFKPDLVIVHWVSNFLNSRNLAEIGALTGAPVFWYFLDDAPFTGGCHYTWECRKFLTHCGACPALNSGNEKDLSWQNFSYKKKFLPGNLIGVLAATSNYHNLAKGSTLFAGNPIAFVPLGIDRDVFKPADKVSVRAGFGLPIHALIILVASDQLSEERKGVAYALQALKLLFDSLTDAERKNIHILLAGKVTDDITRQIRFHFTTLGYVKGDESLARVYQAADLFLCSSLQDGGPMMVMESITCGTPVAGFRIGVMPDAVIEGETGYSAHPGDAEDLAEKLLGFARLDEAARRAMNARCRTHGLESFDPQKQVNGIVSFYNATKRKTSG